MSWASGWRRSSRSSACCAAAGRHQLVLDGGRLRLSLYFAGNCRLRPDGTAPASVRTWPTDAWTSASSKPERWPRSRLVTAVLTGTLGRLPGLPLLAGQRGRRPTANGRRTWLSTDGEVAIAESSFVHGKHPHALVVYRKADG